ncbi:MAG: hypothetical protein C4324_00185 [Blastocatellia bacterium]
MERCRRYFSLIFVFAIGSIMFPIIAFAQDSEPLCSSDFSRMIVDQQAAELGLNLPRPKKVQVLLLTGDFLWDRDNVNARKYFAEALAIAAEHRLESHEKEKSGARPDNVERDLEMSVISAIAKRDAKWAYSLLQKIAKDAAEDPAKDVGLDRLESILSIAKRNAGTDPKLSLDLFRLAIRDFPLDYVWIYTLFETAKQNRPLADQVFTELLQQNSTAEPSRLIYLSHYALARESGIGISQVQVTSKIDDNFKVDPKIRDLFLNYFLASSESFLTNASRPAAPGDPLQTEVVAIFSALDDLGGMVRTLPASLQRRIMITRERARSVMTTVETHRLNNRKNSWFSRTIEQRLAELEKAEKENWLNDVDIANALFGLSGEVSDLRRFEPWIGKFKSDSARSSAADYFWFEMTSAAIKAGDLAAADQFAARIRKPVVKSAAMFNIARAQFANLNNVASGYDILARVSSVARSAPDSADKAAILMGLANLYADFNASFAFTSLADAVTALNKIGPHDSIPDSVVLEIVADNSKFVTMKSVKEFSFSGTFKKMAGIDLGLTLSNAKAIDDVYLRAVAVIATMESCKVKSMAALSEN